MAGTQHDLVEALVGLPRSDYVRFAADWIATGSLDPTSPHLTGDRVLDALVAASAAYLARRNGTSPPGWTRDESRVLDSFWNPAGPRFFSWSLAHTPVDFFNHGIILEEDSLVCV